MLKMEGITKSFGGTQALDDVSVSIEAGNILALLGENGAGKSTLIKILAGVYSKDAGKISFEDKDIEHPKVLQDEKKISFIHQDLGLIEWMTVAENIALTVGFQKKNRFLVDWKKTESFAKDVLKKLDIDIDPKERVMNLSRAEQSLVALSRAICQDTKIIVLDEPTASLPAVDVKKLFEVLRNLKAKNVGIVLVSHRLDEVFAVCDDVVVLRDGKLVNSSPVSDLDEANLIQLIIGKKKDIIQKTDRETFGKELIKVHEIKKDDIGPISFNVEEGEVISLTGLRGAGQEEVSRMLFGEIDIESGSVTVKDQPFHPKSPQDAISSGVGMLAKDRIRESVCTTLTVSENIYMNPNNHIDTKFLYSLKEEKNRTLQKVTDFDIRPKNVGLHISALSGGNQQKAVLARWFDINPNVLILEDPTQGVDIGAKTEIYKYIKEYARKGGAVIIMTTDYEEALAISHTALVFSKGEIVKELHQDDLTLDNLLYYASVYERSTT